MATARRAARRRRFALFWCTTADGSEDWFVVAASARDARRFHEKAEGYDAGDAEAERVVALPDNLQGAAGWRDGPAGRWHADTGWASDELVVACGGEIAPLKGDGTRELLGTVGKDVRFGARRFRAGDVVTTVNRAAGIPEARLSAFKGGRSAVPVWWSWDLELTPHLEKRMEDRDFTEVDLRSMLHSAADFREDVVEGRFVIPAKLRRRKWEVVVEPDEDAHLLVVITAYPVES